MGWPRPTDGLTARQRWARKLADWVTCPAPACGRCWQRTNGQRKDGTVYCCQSCANTVVRRRVTTRFAAAVYRTWLDRDVRLRELSDYQREAVVDLMLKARLDTLNHRARQRRKTEAA